MALVAINGTPLIKVGLAGNQGLGSITSPSSSTVDAAKEALIMYGYVFTEDGASHTIDTTGSSSLGWYTGSITFANAGTTVKVGLATLDTANGPPARAVNVADVITFDVSKSLTGGGGGITGIAWNEHVPDTGTKTIASGDLLAFAIQMTARGGVDSITPAGIGALTGACLPGVTSFLGGAYAVNGRVPLCTITFSDGKLGWFWGGTVISTLTTQTWNSGSATKEYGNLIQFPFPVRAYGIVANPGVGGDCDFVLYSDPLGTPVAERTISVDANAIASATVGSELNILFPAASYFDLKPNTPYAAIMKPGATNCDLRYATMNASAFQKAYQGGANGYAINRASGAFAAQNSSKDRFAIGLIVGAFSHPVRATYQMGF